MFGWGYVIDHCIALFQKKEQEKAIALYMGECLRTIAENTAKSVGGSYITVKLSEILDPKPREERSAEEIIDTIKEKVNNMR